MPSSKRSNPFEELWTKKTKQGQGSKKKHKSLKAQNNVKSYGIVLAKSSGQNRFHDQRVGENDPKLSEEDRYFARLQRERSRGTKKRKRFNLSDLDGADDDTEGSPEDKPQKEDSKEEFPMQDPAAWKYFVVNNAKDDYEQDDGELPDRDDVRPIIPEEDFDETEQLVSSSPVEEEEEGNVDEARPKTRQEIMNEVMLKSKMHKALRQQVKSTDEIQREALDEALPELMEILAQSDKEKTRPEQPKASSNFDYDAAFHSLASERRAHASARLKTEEEKETEERERLEELEKTRLARMAGLDGDEDDEIESESEEDSDGEDEDDGALPDENVEGVKVNDGNIKQATTEDDIPFLYDKCPSECDQLSKVLMKATPSLRGVVIERVRKCFAVSLDSGNGPKLQKLLTLILDRILQLSLNVEQLPAVLEEIGVLTGQVYTLGLKYPTLVAEWSRERLYDAYSDLMSNAEKNLSEFWSVSHVIIFRFIGRLFPGSDVRHNVMTPFLLLISEGISPQRLASDQDFGLASFLCSIFLEVAASNTRASGQVVQFLAAAAAKYCNGSDDDDVANSDEGINLRLKLSECLDTTEDDSCELTYKLKSVVKKLIKAAMYRGKLQHLDLLLDGVANCLPSGDEMKRLLVENFEKQQSSRKCLTMYTQKTRVVPKVVNPKFTAVNGVFKKYNRTRTGTTTLEQAEESRKRVAKALKREERSYARELRGEAMKKASRQNEIENEKREYTNTKTKQLKLFLEEQQATWNQAAKKQKKMSGQKW